MKHKWTTLLIHRTALIIAKTWQRWSMASWRPAMIACIKSLRPYRPRNLRWMLTEAAWTPNPIITGVKQQMAQLMHGWVWCACILKTVAAIRGLKSWPFSSPPTRTAWIMQKPENERDSCEKVFMLLSKRVSSRESPNDARLHFDVRKQESGESWIPSWIILKLCESKPLLEKRLRLATWR